MGAKGSKGKRDSTENADVPVSRISFEKAVDVQAPKSETNSIKIEPVTAVQDTIDTPNASTLNSRADEAAKVPKSVAARLSAPVISTTISTKDSDHKPKSTKLFEAPKGPERSKIYQALNPQKLYYESRREKAEAEEEKEVVVLGQRDYGFMKDDEGNLLADRESDEEDVEEEEDYDPDNLPDFGEYQDEMNRLREERARKQEERRDRLRAEYLAKKAEEERLRQEELKKIAEKEKILSSTLEENSDKIVHVAQQRLETQTTQHLRRFSFH
eukprot:gene6590-7529_t